MQARNAIWREPGKNERYAPSEPGPSEFSVLHTVLAFWKEELTFGDAAVAGGTLALAGVTAYLGIETRATAKAAREAVQAAEEPFVIATPTDNVEAMTLRDWEWSAVQDRKPPPPFEIHRSYDDEDDRDRSAFVRMRLWNVGMGPGIVLGVELLGHGILASSTGTQRPLPVGTVVDLEIPSEHWEDSDKADLVISYTHADGREYRTHSFVTITGDIVRCVSYERQRPEADRPIEARLRPLRNRVWATTKQLERMGEDIYEQRTRERAEKRD